MIWAACLQVTSHTPDAWSCQRYSDELSANMMRCSRQPDGCFRCDAGDVIHTNVDCFSGCVQFVVTTFAVDEVSADNAQPTDGLSNSSPLHQGSVTSSTLFECLPPELQSGTVFVHDSAADPLLFQGGVEQAPVDADLRVRAVPDVCLIFPPCVSSGVETEVEVHLKTNGCGGAKDLRVVGTLEGAVFLDEVLDGEGSVLRSGGKKSVG